MLKHVNDNYDQRQLELDIPSPPRPWASETRQYLAVNTTIAACVAVGALLLWLALSTTTVIGRAG
jgi:hypothetical protein